jgi:hypothetical protein
MAQQGLLQHVVREGLAGHHHKGSVSKQAARKTCMASNAGHDSNVQARCRSRRQGVEWGEGLGVGVGGWGGGGGGRHKHPTSQALSMNLWHC